jgi:3'-phosphoadenosine 5'-phosphosulfate sulfotransferase (PAPS reductase)/FAD synthetase
MYEQHRTTNKKRMVHHFRPVIDWDERAVWEAMESAGIRPHPCYELGWGRCSCALCIFGNANQWATAKHVLPRQFAEVAAYEKRFKKTIHRTKSVEQLVSEGSSYLKDLTSDEAHSALLQAQSPSYELNIRPDRWELPAGAYKKDGGPS